MQCKARSSAKDFCELFGWPLMKTFTFNLYGEEASNQLAREWVRKSNYYMMKWLDSAGKELFDTPASRDCESSEAFLDWATTVDDVYSPTFGKIQELLDQTPRLGA